MLHCLAMATTQIVPLPGIREQGRKVICSKCSSREPYKIYFGTFAGHKDEGFYIDKHGKVRTFDQKKLSRKRGRSLRGKGWKYGSGFVDGVFPVLSPMAQQILEFVRKEVEADKIRASLASNTEQVLFN